MNRGTAFLWLWVLWIAAASVGGCSVQRESVSIALSLEPMSALAVIADTEGFLRKEGLDVTIKEYASGHLALQGMLKGEAEFATVAGPPIVMNSFERNDFKVFATIATSDNDAKIVARRDRGIAQPADLAYTDKDVRLAERIGSQIAGAIANAQLYTERIQSEKERAALEEQLHQSQRMEAIGQLAGGVAHDFNNLLTVIKGYSQISLMELKEGDPLKPNMEEIQNAATRAAELTKQLLAFSRRQIMEFKVLDLNTVLRNLNKMLRRLIGEDIELLTFLSGGLGRVKTDSGQIEQVVMNLVVNARDAMRNGGKMTIETANLELDEEYAWKHVAVKPGNYVMLSVSDTGEGMSPEVRDRVFEPFFTTKERGKGTGLGLSTVYGIVKQSGGNIWVYSELGKGTTFKIYLPRVDQPLSEERKPLRKEEIPLGNETILLVEDEEGVRKLAVRVLKKQGYRVPIASQGEEALSVCREYKEPIHLLVTDVVMPKMSGRDVARLLEQIHPETKVLYMSGYTDTAIAHYGVLDEGIEYLQKPFTVDALARKVREVLDK
jgi:signal transduction histidine kinase/CheY-like chemotaxis protein